MRARDRALRKSNHPARHRRRFPQQRVRVELGAAWRPVNEPRGRGARGRVEVLGILARDCPGLDLVNASLLNTTDCGDGNTTFIYSDLAAGTYRDPANLITADVFSDPPMNAAPVVKQGGSMRLADGVEWQATGAAANLTDGRYTMGLRPHFVSPRGGPGVALTGEIAIAELTGSESVAHFSFAGRTWVAQSDGMHPYQIGTSQEFRLDVARGLYFDDTGRRVA